MGPRSLAKKIISDFLNNAECYYLRSDDRSIAYETAHWIIDRNVSDYDNDQIETAAYELIDQTMACSNCAARAEQYNRNVKSKQPRDMIA